MKHEHVFSPYRHSAMRLLVGLMWANWLLIVPVGFVLGSSKTWTSLAVGLAALAIPTIGLVRGRDDVAMRVALGFSAAIFPALMVALTGGTPWQMDLHMYFFVSMAVLLLLLDWRPIVACTLLTAVHHLVLLYALPEWVFPGSGSLARVMLHAGLVGGQAAILIFTTQQLRRLILRGELARTNTERARAAAEAAETQARQTLGELRAAQAEGRRQLEERHAAEAALADATRARRATVASEIHERIGTLAAELRSAAETLSTQEGALEGVAQRLTNESQGLRTASEKSLSNVVSVSESAAQLRQATADAEGNVQHASELVGETAGTVRALEPRMQALAQEIDSARGILDLVSAIAAQSNLLALNATIEAARAGDSGLGFGVVAHEMKQMAQRTAAATIQIAEKLDLIAGAAATFTKAVETTSSHMQSAGESALAVSTAVDQQRGAIAAIVRAAEAVRQDVSDTDARSRTIGEAVQENRAIAAHTSDLARLLDTRARALGENMDRLIADLRAA